MFHRRFVSAVLGAAVAALASIPANAQGMDGKEIVANVAFAFYVGERSFPAGSYNVSATNIGADTVTIRLAGGKDTTTLPVISRLAHRTDSPQATATSLIFAYVGDRKYLSEVWIPGREGYLVGVTAHTEQQAFAAPAK